MGTWDEAYSGGLSPGPDEWFLALLPAVHGRPGRLLDCGCGNGVQAGLASDRAWDVTGIDPSAEAVGLAAMTVSGASFSVGSPSSVTPRSLPGFPFDAVLSDLSLHYGTRVESVADVLFMAEAAPGGILMCRVNSDEDTQYSDDPLDDEGRHVGPSGAKRLCTPDWLSGVLSDAGCTGIRTWRSTTERYGREKRVVDAYATLPGSPR